MNQIDALLHKQILDEDELKVHLNSLSELRIPGRPSQSISDKNSSGDDEMLEKYFVACYGPTQNVNEFINEFSKQPKDSVLARSKKRIVEADKQRTFSGINTTDELDKQLLVPRD